MQPLATPRALQKQITASPWFGAVLAFLALYVFLVAVHGLGGGFKSLGGGLLEGFFRATTNPFLGLIIGLLTTTIVQSSSVTTSLIVAMVAAPENPLPIANAVPMVMGANIGTTVTNTIVSLAHMGRPDEFRRAFAVATCHDFFNFFSVLILLPLELGTGYLQKSATWIASELAGSVEGVHYHSPIKAAIKAGAKPLHAFAAFISDSTHVQAILTITICGVLIYASLLTLVRLMRTLLREKVEAAVSRALDRNPVFAMLIGLVVTAIIQSSSITTSLLVPLGGAGIITLAQAFPVTIGANIGTTVTALLASLAVTGENATAGVAIALVHLLFNLSGTVLIYPAPQIRRLPLAAARLLAEVAGRNRVLALAYVGGLFYLLPMVLAALNH